MKKKMGELIQLKAFISNLYTATPQTTLNSFTLFVIVQCGKMEKLSLISEHTVM